MKKRDFLERVYAVGIFLFFFSSIILLLLMAYFFWFFDAPLPFKVLVSFASIGISFAVIAGLKIH